MSPKLLPSSASSPILPTTVETSSDPSGDMTVSPFQSLLNWDKDVSYIFYRRCNQPRLPHLLLELSGHGVPWLIIPILVFLLKSSLSPTSAALLLNFLALTVVDLAVIGLLKPAFHRKRPAYNTGIGHVTIHAVDQFSFPSGHATRAGFLATFVCYVRWKHEKGLHPFIDTNLFTALVFVWAIAVCASRVALGRHHVLDVICGALVGASYVFWWNPLWISDDYAQALRSGLMGAPSSAAQLDSMTSGLQSNT